MNILYLSNKDLDDQSGVSHKVLMQVSEWSRLGHNVSILSLKSLAFFSEIGEQITDPLIEIKGTGLKTIYRIICSDLKLKELIDPSVYDIIYFRNRPYTPFFIRFFKNVPLLLEINTNDLEEDKLLSIGKRWYNLIFRKKLLKNVSGFVFVSNELKKIYSKYSANKPNVVIANSYQVPNKSPEPTQNERITLTFICASPLPWHGIDKVIWLSENIPEYNFNVVGINGDNRKNLIYHGNLPNEKIAEILNQTDIGLGTLSLYKKAMDEASPLKTRQYFANGVPTIYAYKDTDLNGDEEFCLKLPNNEGNIKDNLSEIKAFANKVHNNIQLRYEAYSFAKKSLDIKAREESRLSFFKEFLI